MEGIERDAYCLILRKSGEYEKRVFDLAFVLAEREGAPVVKPQHVTAAIESLDGLTPMIAGVPDRIESDLNGERRAG